MDLVGRVRLPRGGHFIFLSHHPVVLLAVVFIVLVVLAVRSSRR